MRLYDVATKASLGTLRPKIVSIGGGTGLSTLLRGLKKRTTDLTAVVAVSDNGGGSGFLRQDLGMLPPGDIRNCILALAQTEPMMERLLSYRFSEGTLAGQSFGNLFLAAMTGISPTFEEAVKRVGDVLKVTGRVLPVTTTDVQLEAVLKDGTVLFGETNVSTGPKMGERKIDTVRLVPGDAMALPDVTEAILEADIVTLGPGSLYTSVIPNLLVGGVPEALAKTKAKIYYICNIMTQPGETDEMTVFDHVQAIRRHAMGNIISHCLVNTQPIPEPLLHKYQKDHAYPVRLDAEKLLAAGVRPICGNFLRVRGDYIRHDYDALAKCLLDRDESPLAGGELADCPGI